MRTTPRRLLCLAVIPAVVALAGCEPDDVSLLLRPEAPLVVTGGSVPQLVGADPSAVVAFRYIGVTDRWTQVPVQVDERHVVDLGIVHDRSPSGVTNLAYSDPGTLTGPDPDPTLDANDEVVLLVRDAGGDATAEGEPPGVVPGSGTELRITNPLLVDGIGWLYLFENGGALDPAAGVDLVDYDFRLVAGDYPDDYAFEDGPNPEDTTATTASYSLHFTDRWVNDELRITAGGASGADLLDRNKVWFAPGVCERTENTFADSHGAFVTSKDGPLRAIRDVIGANSGQYTQRRQIFYPYSYQTTTFLRVHSLPEGPDDLMDYAPAATGMRYANALNPAGVVVDGVPDTVATGTIDWETLAGSQGSLVLVHDLDTNIAPLGRSSYYQDRSNTPVVMCTGDAHAYGTTGPTLTGPLPSTDGTSSFLTFDRDHHVLPPDATAEAMQTRVDWTRNPLVVEASAFAG